MMFHSILGSFPLAAFYKVYIFREEIDHLNRNNCLSTHFQIELLYEIVLNTFVVAIDFVLGKSRATFKITQRFPSFCSFNVVVICPLSILEDDTRIVDLRSKRVIKFFMLKIVGILKGEAVHYSCT